MNDSSEGLSILSVDLDKNMNDSAPPLSYSMLMSNMTDMSNLTVIRTGNRTEIVGNDKIFLNTAIAQALSGVFVWSALLITCHQVDHLAVNFI